MAKTNTEKPTGKAQEKKQAKTPKTKKEDVVKAPVKKEEKKAETDKKPEEEIKKVEETPVKKPVVKKAKKSSVTSRIENASVSTKFSISICKFILHKKIPRAIKELEEVSNLRKAVPMKGEYAHRKGKMMSGKYPVNASKMFIVLLKNLQANANQHDLEEPVITMAVANKGSTVYGSRGRTLKKRTHITITASEKKSKNKEDKK
ncbi:MAG: hypothetical protein KKB62_03390 [Nanoarchaeota archaeon]|nr:hypothetical protein [Nanoarchaeota archaeon]